MARDATLTIRLTAEVRQAINAAAEADGRSVSQWVERTISAILKKQGYLAK